MGELIGYKGTPSSRQEDWETLILERKSIKWFTENGHKHLAILEKEKMWYKEDLANYVN